MGTRIDGRTSVTLIWLFIRIKAIAAAGLAPSRSNRPIHCLKAGSSCLDGANRRAIPPLPQSRSM